MRAVSAFLIALAALSVLPKNAQAQLFVTQAVGSGSVGIVTQYSTHTRQSPITPNPLVTGLSNPLGLALTSDGKSLFVSNNKTGVVGKYNVSDGSPDPAFESLTKLKGVTGLAVSTDGKTLYVASFGTVSLSGPGTGTVGSYDAALGAKGTTNNPTFLPNLPGPTGLAYQANVLYVALCGNMLGQTGFITAYDATEGGAFNPNPLITGLSQPGGIALSGNELYVVNEGNGTVTKYKITGSSTGFSVTESSPAPFISNLNAPSGIAITGNSLFITLTLGQVVVEYDAKSGGQNDAAFETGLLGPAGIVVK